MPVLRYWDPTLNQFVALSGMGPQGPPAAASSPLAYVKYGPTTMAGYTFTTALGPFDTVNMTIRFTAPASGSVIAKAAIYLRSMQPSVTTAENIPMMCFVTHGTSTQCSPQQRMIDLQLGTPGGNFVGGTTFYEQPVTGLTPGQVYQWDLAGYYYVTGGTGGATAYTDSGTGTFPVGPAIMSIYDSAGVGAQGPQGPQGLQGNTIGTAGGDLSGTYPNPTVAKIFGQALGMAATPAAWDALCYWSGGPSWVNFPVVQDIQNIPANGITATSNKAGSGTGGSPIAGDVTLKVTLPWSYNGLNGNMTCAATTNYSVCGSSLAAGMWLILAQATFVPSAAAGYTFWIGTGQASASGVLVPWEVTIPSDFVGQSMMASFFALTNQGSAFNAWLNHYGAGCTIRSNTSNYGFAAATGLTSIKVG